MAGGAESRAKGSPQEIGMQVLAYPVPLMKKMTGDTTDPVFFIKRHIRRYRKRRNNRYRMPEYAAVLPRFTGIGLMTPQADILNVGIKLQVNSFQGQGHMTIQAPDLRVIMGRCSRRGRAAAEPCHDQE